MAQGQKLLRHLLRKCHLPIWRRKMERTNQRQLASHIQSLNAGFPLASGAAEMIG